MQETYDRSWLERPTNVAELAHQHNEAYYHWFARVVTTHLPEGGTALDIGAGGGLPKGIASIRARAGRLIGVDPSPAIYSHPDLDEKICRTFEGAELPDECVDVAFAYNVVEHIARPLPFVQQAYRLLRPGGWFFFLTPNRHHPFALLSRGMEVLGFKPLMRRLVARGADGEFGVNDYPAYYRMNCQSAALPLAQSAGFREVHWFYIGSGWKHYFPRVLWAVPKTYDRMVEQHFPAGRLLFAAAWRK